MKRKEEMSGKEGGMIEEEEEMSEEKGGNERRESTEMSEEKGGKQLEERMVRSLEESEKRNTPANGDGSRAYLSQSLCCYCFVSTVVA